MNAMLAVSTIKGGIRIGKAKEVKATGESSQEREPVLAAKG